MSASRLPFNDEDMSCPPCLRVGASHQIWRHVARGELRALWLYSPRGWRPTHQLSMPAAPSCA